MTRRCVVLSLFLLLAAPYARAADYPWQSLLNGEIIVERVTNADDLPGIRALFAISANRDAIWHTLLDYLNYKNIFSDLDTFTVLNEDASGAVLEYQTDAVFTSFHYILRRDYVVPGFHMTWRNIGGDFKTIEGSWTLKNTPDPDKTILIFESYVDADSAVLGWIIKAGAMARARKMAQELRDWIE